MIRYAIISSPDQIAIPDFAAGAMENWGLITYREERLLWDPLMSTLYEKQRAAGTIAHELLHQVCKSKRRENLSMSTLNFSGWAM
jgi:aminopeptidase N